MHKHCPTCTCKSPKLPLSKAETQRVIDAKQSGWTVKQIAKQFCVSEECIKIVLYGDNQYG
jgi:DNA-binding NarL/FixJ family response regulator